jgi:uncharacterized protein DUF4124
MNLRAIIIVVLVNGLFLPVAYSEMFTCEDADGSKVFSDKPCQGNGSTLIKRGSVPVNENVQESNEIRQFMAVTERKAAERKQRNQQRAAAEHQAEQHQAEQHQAEQRATEQRATESEISPIKSRPKTLIKLYGGPGYVDTDGTYYPEVPGGAVDTETGRFIPSN